MGVGGQRHAPAALPQGKRLGTHCIEGSVGPRVCLYGCGKSPPHRDLTPSMLEINFTSVKQTYWRVLLPRHLWFCSQKAPIHFVLRSTHATQAASVTKLTMECGPKEPTGCRPRANTTVTQAFSCLGINKVGTVFEDIPRWKSQNPILGMPCFYTHDKIFFGTRDGGGCGER